MRIAILQYEIVWEDKKANQANIKLMLASNNFTGIDLVLLPEMSLTGFSMAVGKTGEKKRETISFFSDLAKRYSFAMGFGWVELEGSRGKNHYTIVNSAGNIILDYIKIHPFSFGMESQYFLAGTEIHKTRIKDCDLSAVICYDLRFPELFQSVSNNVNVIIVPANWPAIRQEHWLTLLKARAIENQVYIVGVNCIGKVGQVEYSGSSIIFDPEGNIVLDIHDQKGLFIGEIKPEITYELRSKFSLKRDRKPALYCQLYGEKNGQYI